MFHWKPLFALLVALGITPVPLLVSANGYLAEDGQLTAHARRSNPEPLAEYPLSRFIVKFKEDINTKPLALNEAHGRQRINALSASDTSEQRRRGERRTFALAYLKTILPHTHVVTTSHPLNRSAMLALIKDIRQDPRIAYAGIDERVYPHFVPNDTLYAAQQWNLKASAGEAGGANFPNAWDSATGTGVTIAILDSGYLAHADLASNVVQGYDFISEDPNGGFTTANDGDGRDADATDPGDWNSNPTSDCPTPTSSWHGTRVAGIAAAVSNNAAGIAGAAFGARILPVRVLGVCGGYISDIAAGMQWAAGLPVAGAPLNTAHVAKVINLSLGARGACDPIFQEAISLVVAAHSVVVVSTGNNADSTVRQPANCTGVIAVTAHTRLGDSATYANIGTGTSISAPGGGSGRSGLSLFTETDAFGVPISASSIYSTANSGLTVAGGDSYISANGTSFAAPHVAGVAALLYQIRPTLSPAKILSYITSTARPHPPGSYCAGRSDCGAGLLDASNAVAALLVAQGTPNRVPVLNPVLAQTVPATTTLQFTATGSDADGDAVSFQVSGLPVGASFNGATGVFTWTNAQPLGTYTFTIQPTDGIGLGTMQTVTVRVTAAPANATSGGGGGGGTIEWFDVLALALFATSSLALRKGVPEKQVH